jgi:NAD(P)-dependent dehydrogenase (short-subunit alcohol dehydrogenase family)/SAM-dependent methyltransferase
MSTSVLQEQAAAALFELEFRPLALGLLYDGLRSLGLVPPGVDGRAVACSPPPLSRTHERWLSHSIEVLIEAGYLQREAGELRSTAATRIVAGDLWRSWMQRRGQHANNPLLAAQLDLVQDMMRALPQILRGSVRATQIIFPKGSTRRAEEIYRTDPNAKSLNRILSERLRRYVEDKIDDPVGTRLRFIELGAGTATTTEWLLEAIGHYRQHVAEYCFTDLSPVFLTREQAKYAVRYPYLTFRLLDIDRPVGEQGLEAGAFDAMIAANVLHVARNIRYAIRNAKALLKSEGLMLLGELGSTNVFLHLTFALLEGWWRYDDAHLRVPGSPAMSLENWRWTLAQEGFAAIQAAAAGSYGPAHHAIFAESDGLVRSPTRGGVDHGGEGAPVSGCISAGEPREVASGLERYVIVLPVWSVVLPDIRPQWPATRQNVVIVGDPADCPQLLDCYPQAQVIPMGGRIDIEGITRSSVGCEKLDHLFWIAPREPADSDQGALIAAQDHGVLAFFRLVKTLLAQGYRSRLLGLTVLTRAVQAVYSWEETQPAHAGIHGLLGSLAKEYPLWNIRIVDLPPAGLPGDTLLRIPPDRAGDSWAYRDGQWYRRTLLECTLPSTGFAGTYRRGGVYVLIGGAGGIGVALTRHLIHQYRAQVIWLGRRPRDERIEAKLAGLAQNGAPMPYYLSVDAGDLEAMRTARESILQRHGQIHGVVHAAVAPEDSTLARLTEERFRAGLRAKIDTSVRLGEVFGNYARDFIVFFSSLQSFGRLPGQSSFAAGSTFQDAYAHWLVRRCACKVRVINWGYWGSVGCVATELHRARMQRQGVGSIEPERAMVVLQSLLAERIQQLGFMRIGAAGSPERFGIDTQGVVTVYPGKPASTQSSVLH